LRGALRTDSDPTADARLDLQDRRLPADTADTASIPAGLHLTFRSTGRAFVIRFTYSGQPHPMSPPTRVNSFTLWHGEQIVASALAETGEVTMICPSDSLDGSLEFTLYLPEALGVTVESIETAGTLEPPTGRPLVLAYGDSIVQGWSTTDPGRSWTAVVGRALGAEVCNLGFAGAARGEVAVAEQIAGTNRSPDAVILAFGTNSWTFPPTTPVALAETLRIFVTTLRQKWAEIPIIVISPIVRPDADHVPNRLGATLHDLRMALETAASERDDIILVPGLPLMPASALVDGIHPGDEGHAAIAAAVVAAIGDL